MTMTTEITDRSGDADALEIGVFNQRLHSLCEAIRHVRPDISEAEILEMSRQLKKTWPLDPDGKRRLQNE